MQPRPLDLSNARSILNELNRLPAGKIAVFIANHPEIVQRANSWLAGKQNIVLASSHEQEKAYSANIRSAFESRLENDSDLLRRYLDFVERRISKKKSDQLPDRMDTGFNVGLFLEKNPAVKEQLINDYKIIQPPNMVTQEEYLVWALVTDDVTRIDPRLLDQAAYYLSESLAQGLVSSVEKIASFLINPQQFMEDRYQETIDQSRAGDVDNRYVNLSGAALTKLRTGGDMKWFYMNGFNLANADLKLANLEHAFMNHANLQGAKMDGAKIDNMQFDDAAYDKHHLAQVIRDAEEKKQARSKAAPGQSGSLPGPRFFKPAVTPEKLAEEKRRKASLQTEPVNPDEKESKRASLKERLSGFMKRK